MNWLSKKSYSTGIHRFYRHRDIAVTGNKDDRNLDLRIGQFVLEFQPASAGQPDIQNEATRLLRYLVLEEFAG